MTTAANKRPRHYASAYLAAKTPEQQREAVAGCPEQWRELVKKHVKLLKMRVVK